jgi:hypothetical protein
MSDAKMPVNLSRNWAIRPDGTGHHVDDTAPDVITKAAHLAVVDLLETWISDGLESYRRQGVELDRARAAWIDSETDLCNAERALQRVADSVTADFPKSIVVDGPRFKDALASVRGFLVSADRSKAAKPPRQDVRHPAFMTLCTPATAPPHASGGKARGNATTRDRIGIQPRLGATPKGQVGTWERGGGIILLLGSV